MVPTFWLPEIGGRSPSGRIRGKKTVSVAHPSWLPEISNHLLGDFFLVNTMFNLAGGKHMLRVSVRVRLKLPKHSPKHDVCLFTIFVWNIETDFILCNILS